MKHSVRKLTILLFCIASCVCLLLFRLNKHTVVPYGEIFVVQTEECIKNFDTIKTQIQLFSSELSAEIGCTPLPITYDSIEVASDDAILFNLQDSDSFTEQGYTIFNNGSQLCISADDVDGLFYGGRHVIKQLKAKGYVVDISDEPTSLERGLFMDVGRKYFSKNWIEDMIKEMSWSNLNTLYIHFSEDMGLRLESKKFPWLAGSDGTLCPQGSIADSDQGKYLTQDEMIEIAQIAKKYHVQIIPSFDSPGHLNYVVKAFNEKATSESFSYTDYNGNIITVPKSTNISNYYLYDGVRTSVVPGSGDSEAQTAYARGIDITNEFAVNFIMTLIDEYAKFFKNSCWSTHFDIGGDELLGWGKAVVSTESVPRWQQLDHWKAYARSRAKSEGKSETFQNGLVAYDAFMYYMNDIYMLLNNLGYSTVRMWNDDILRTTDTGWGNDPELHIVLNPNIQVQYWTNSANNGENSIETYIDAGYRVYNFINTYNYYAMIPGYFNGKSYPKTNPKNIYNEWNPFVFDDEDYKCNSNYDVNNILGSALCMWCDNPNLQTESEIKSDLLPLIRANGEKAWNYDINSTVTYHEFLSMW